MKHFNTGFLIRAVALLLTLISLFCAVSCDSTEEPPAETTASTTEAETEAPTEAATKPPIDTSNDGRARIILASDLHYTTIETYYTVSADKRMQHFVDNILAEHKSNPIDLLIFVGDVSLDHLFKRGTWTVNKESTTKTFLEKYGSQIKAANIPYIVLPGNHEQFNDQQWEEITGNKRNVTVEVEGVLFIMPDSYGQTLEPNYDVVNGAVYTPMNVEYIKDQLALHPHCKKAVIVTHGFWPGKEPAEFEELMRTEPRLAGIFNGDSHANTVKDLGYKYGYKKQAQTGHFSQFGENLNEATKSCFWGFRELILTPTNAVSRYITVESKGMVGGKVLFQVKRTTGHSVIFY